MYWTFKILHMMSCLPNKSCSTESKLRLSEEQQQKYNNNHDFFSSFSHRLSSWISEASMFKGKTKKGEKESNKEGENS